MAIIAIIANIVLSILLMGPLSHGGLALATSLASMLNLILLIRALRNRLGALGWQHIIKSVFKSLVCSVMMGAAVWAVAGYLIPLSSATFRQLALGIFGSVTAGTALYLLFSFWVKNVALETVLAMVRQRIQTK